MATLYCLLVSELNNAKITVKNFYRLEEPIYCIYVGASWTRFSVITSSKRNVCG